MYIEEQLYLDFGIPIQVTSNKERAIANTNIIINIDFDYEKFSKYKVFNEATIINIKEEFNIEDRVFKGRVINKYKIEYDEEILDEIKDKTDFDSNILYESLIYRKDTFKNIKKQMQNDKVKLVELF